MKYLDDNTEKELQEVSDIFSALSSPKRLKIISLIGNNALSVTEIAQKMECRPPCVSQHLSVLTHARSLIVRGLAMRLSTSFHSPVSSHSCHACLGNVAMKNHHAR